MSDPTQSAHPGAPRTRVALIVVAGGADALGAGEPTALHEAGTPALDRVARDGHLGRVVLGAPTCWAGFLGLLGQEPGVLAIGPAELRAAGVDAGGARWAARADFVTVDSERVLDAFGGGVGDPEAAALLDAVAAELALVGDVLAGARLVRLSGPRNVLLAHHELPPGLPAWHAGRRTLRSALGADGPARALFDVSHRALAAHDVNAVRLDLGENPANALWLHGAGPLGAAGPAQLAAPSWSAGRRVAIVSDGGAPSGVAAALGWDAVEAAGDADALCAGALEALTAHDCVVVRTSAALAAGLRAHDDVRGARAAAFSELDARLVGPLLGALEESGPFVLAVAADGAFDAESRTFSSEPVWCGVLASGGAGHGGTAFHERACAEGARLDGPAAFSAFVEHALHAD